MKKSRELILRITSIALIFVITFIVNAIIKNITETLELNVYWDAISVIVQSIGVIISAFLTITIIDQTRQNHQQMIVLQKAFAKKDDTNTAIQRRMDLFTRRYEIYQELKGIMSSVNFVRVLYLGQRIPNTEGFSLSEYISNMIFNGISNENVLHLSQEIAEQKIRLEKLEQKPKADYEDIEETRRRIGQLMTNKLLIAIDILKEKLNKVRLSEFFFHGEITDPIMMLCDDYMLTAVILLDDIKRKQIDERNSPEIEKLVKSIDKVEKAEILKKMKDEIQFANDIS